MIGLFDRLLDDLADRIADRLLASMEPEPSVHIENMHVVDDRYTPFERSIMEQRAKGHYGA